MGAYVDSKHEEIGKKKKFRFSAASGCVLQCSFRTALNGRRIKLYSDFLKVIIHKSFNILKYKIFNGL
jgi:hypothetical protein